LFHGFIWACVGPGTRSVAEAMMNTMKCNRTEETLPSSRRARRLSVFPLPADYSMLDQQLRRPAARFLVREFSIFRRRVSGINVFAGWNNVIRNFSFKKVN